MIDSLFGRQWKKGYTCHEFACEAWELITGEKLELGNRKEIEKPLSPCVVFLYNNERSDSHVGVFYNEKVLHLSARGVQHIPLEFLTMSFRKVSFYK